MIVDRLGTCENYKLLLTQCQELIESIGWDGSRPYQISLQVDPKKELTKESWYDSCGKSGPNSTDQNFSMLHPDLKGTEIEKWIDSFSFPIFRLRLMVRPEMSCYSIHRDISKRIHLPLKTNESCLFCFPEISKMFHLVEGVNYIVDTRITHTFINCSYSDRIHLVGCVD